MGARLGTPPHPSHHTHAHAESRAWIQEKHWRLQRDPSPNHCPNPDTDSPLPARLWIQENHWRPLPSGPPAKIWNTGIILARAPPSLASTMPVRRMTTRACARLAAPSHSRQTCAWRGVCAGRGGVGTVSEHRRSRRCAALRCGGAV